MRSDALQRIITDMRQQVIDAAEACKRLAGPKDETLGFSDFAAHQGLSETSLAVYGLLDRAANPKLRRPMCSRRTGLHTASPSACSCSGRQAAHPRLS